MCIHYIQYTYILYYPSITPIHYGHQLPKIKYSDGGPFEYFIIRFAEYNITLYNTCPRIC